MSDLQFNEPGSTIIARRPKIKKKTFADRLIERGLAKDEAQANLYLIVFVIIGFGLIIYINLKTFSAPAMIELAPEEIPIIE